MIPDFDDHGYLPPGIHPASLDELEARFGNASEIRRSEQESLVWLCDLARRAGAKRIIVNGSYVTDVIEPNDVDCVILIDSAYPKDIQAASELQAGLPFIDLRLVDWLEFEYYVTRHYTSDRNMVPKGVIEVPL